MFLKPVKAKKQIFIVENIKVGCFVHIFFFLSKIVTQIPYIFFSLSKNEIQIFILDFSEREEEITTIEMY